MARSSARGRSQTSLTVTFVAVSMVAFVLLGVALVDGVGVLVRKQVDRDAVQTAIITTNLAVEQPFASLPPTIYLKELPGPQQVALDKAFVGTHATVDALRLWSPSGKLTYASDYVPAGTAYVSHAVMASTMGIGVQSRVITGTHGDPELDVFVPLTGDSSSVYGVAEVRLPYQDTLTRIISIERVIALMVLGGLLIVWLLLLRTIYRASKRLRLQSAENARLALQDPLTGLPNRRLLNERLERAAVVAGRSGDRVALMLLDIDRFKEVNDTLGHDRGDLLLRQVAERLTSAVRDMDTVARLGGDEFAILLPLVASLQDAEFAAERVLDVFKEPFEFGGLTLHVDTSIGVAVMPDHADDVTTVMQHADIAMYQAKAMHSGIAMYSSNQDAHSTSHLVLLGDLRQAIGSDELSVHFQPKVSLTTGEVVGFEALLRWQHPTRGMVPPAEFVPLAERTGLIHSLTRLVLTLVVEQLAEWRKEGITLPVAVNLSARNLEEPDLADFISELLTGVGVPASLLELEITESAMISDPVRANEMLDSLAALGLYIAVDDFGTGYTSMAQLERMPLRMLKIDRTFVWRMLDDPGGAVLVKAIIDLAHEFNLSVVAEGVEDVEMITELRRLGCDTAQGFHWSKPVPAAEVPAMMRRIADGDLAEVASVPSHS